MHNVKRFPAEGSSGQSNSAEALQGAETLLKAQMLCCVWADNTSTRQKTPVHSFIYLLFIKSNKEQNVILLSNTDFTIQLINYQNK